MAERQSRDASELPESLKEALVAEGCRFMTEGGETHCVFAGFEVEVPWHLIDCGTHTWEPWCCQGNYRLVTVDPEKKRCIQPGAASGADAPTQSSQHGRAGAAYACANPFCDRLREYEVGFDWGNCCKECFASNATRHSQDCDQTRQAPQQGQGRPLG